MRNVEHFAGLALHGSASVGPVRLRTPTVLEAGPDDVRPGQPYLRNAPAGSGLRGLVIGDTRSTVGLELPVLAPEITPTPTGVFPVGPSTYLLHAPLDPVALRGLRPSRPELLILGNARALWNDGEALIEAIAAIRTEVGAEPLLWCPRLALPHRLALLVYLGFDLLDTTEGELRSSAGEFLDLTLGVRPLAAVAPERGCDCASCRSIPPGPVDAHTRALYRRAAAEVDAALATGTLRELVEARLASETTQAELLRYADRRLAGLLEARAPVVSTGRHLYILSESLRRPEMRRFRQRLLERYRPPASKTVLLLVPCSRTKPYRRSPSHRRFATALEGLRPAERVHVVSISSPIGVVPRELEDVSPARQYDIPVTGDWTGEEQAVVRRGVQHLLVAGHYQQVLAHLDEGEYGFLLDALPADRTSRGTVVDGRPTSPGSIARLREALARSLDGCRPVPGGPLTTVAEELHELASVQFGRTAADRLFERPLRLVGRPWFQRLTDGRQELASVREERGLFHLTVVGAERLGDALARVEVEPGLTLEGDVFAPGVLHADEAIRAGDSVGLFQGGALAAIGEAVLPGPLLGDLRHGLAVRVRHRRRPPADTAKTAEPPSPAGR